MIRCWQIFGEEWGNKKVWGCENPPCDPTPDAVRAYWLSRFPDHVIDKVVPHPGGVAAARSIMDVMAMQSVKTKDKIDESLKQCVQGAKWTRTENKIWVP